MFLNDIKWAKTRDEIRNSDNNADQNDFKIHVVLQTHHHVVLKHSA